MLCVGQVEDIVASGSPAEGVSYRFESSDPAVVAVTGACDEGSSCTGEIQGLAVGEATVTAFMRCDLTGHEVSDTMQVHVFRAELIAEYINQDAPQSDQWEPLTVDHVFGGRESQTADDLRFRVETDEMVSVHEWSVTGPGSERYPPPQGPNESTWHVGDIFSVPGDLVFSVTVQFGGLETCSMTRPIRVGIRSDHVVVVGWINGVDGAGGVTLPMGQSAWLSDENGDGPMPRSGPPSGLIDREQCFEIMGRLSEADDLVSFSEVGMTTVDQEYILNWTFKYAANVNPDDTIPGGDFESDDGPYLDQGEVNNFLENKKHDYKLFSEAQVKFFANGPDFDGAVEFLHSRTGIGVTDDPCSGIDFAGQACTMDGLQRHGPQRVSLVNDGCHSAEAARAHNTLMGMYNHPGPVPLFWEDIGSRISFDAIDAGRSTVVVQDYPTYYVYINGRKLETETHPQAPAPGDHFQSNPYPFGTDGCLCIFNHQPAGRCGYCPTPPEPSARQPPYTLP